MRVPSSAAAWLPTVNPIFTELKARALIELAENDESANSSSGRSIVDPGARELMAAINGAEGYFVTSCCAGRVSVYCEPAKPETEVTRTFKPAPIPPAPTRPGPAPPGCYVETLTWSICPEDKDLIGVPITRPLPIRPSPASWSSRQQTQSASSGQAGTIAAAAPAAAPAAAAAAAAAAAPVPVSSGLRERLDLNVDPAGSKAAAPELQPASSSRTSTGATVYGFGPGLNPYKFSYLNGLYWEHPNPTTSTANDKNQPAPDEDKENKPPRPDLHHSSRPMYLYASHDTPRETDMVDQWPNMFILAGPYQQATECNPRHIYLKFEPMVFTVITASPHHAQVLIRAAHNAGFSETGAVKLTAHGQLPAHPVVTIRSVDLAFESIIGIISKNGCRVPMFATEQGSITLMRIICQRYADNTARRDRLVREFPVQLLAPPIRRSLGMPVPELEQSGVDTGAKRKREAGEFDSGRTLRLCLRPAPTRNGGSKVETATT